jgi:hypothetical protein
VLGVWASHAKAGATRFLLGQSTCRHSTSWSERWKRCGAGSFETLASQKAALQNPASCQTQERPPHIILIHQSGAAVLPAVTSHGRRSIRSSSLTMANCIACASKPTVAHVVDGIFGAGWCLYLLVRQLHVGTMLMQGKFTTRCRKALARCGYRNAVFYPCRRTCIQRPVLCASGMPEIDFSPGAKRYNERDRFYYATPSHSTASRHIESADLHPSSPPPPTLRPPTSQRLTSWQRLTDPEMSEYLRRLAMAKMD